MMHYWYHNIVCIFIMTYFIAVRFREIYVSPAWR